ncbi:MAG: hypothetical protein ACP5PV_05930 [Methanothrix sp.]
MLRIVHATLPLTLITFFQIIAFGSALAENNMMQAAPGQAVGLDLSLGSAKTSLEITAPGLISDWTLQPQESPNTWEETLVVKTTGPWTISVYPDTITAGHLSEYDSAISAFVQDGLKLSEPIVIAAQGGNRVDLSQGGILIQGQDDQVVPITFEQKVGWTDPVLSEGHSYQIGLTFSGTAE